MSAPETGTATMNPHERVEAALAGAPVDRVPVSLWHHFPERDQTAESLADATYAFWLAFEFDFIKFMPPGDYPTIDWGARSESRGARAGTRQTTYFPVTEAADWARIRPVDAGAGLHAEMNRAIALLQERLEHRVPVLQTVFSPLTIAQKLSDGRAVQHATEEPELLKGALEAIAETARGMVRAALAAGADGIFFATQCANAATMPADAYAEFGTPYDLAVLEAAQEGSRFTLLHIHGLDIYFDALARYPVHAINWHDRRTSPALTEGRDRAGKAAVGGIDEHGPVVTGAVADARAEVEDALAATGGRRVMIAPGCVIPIDTPRDNIAAAVRAARGE
ncbi:MAG TPA: uroporphyrinogen decarboxylase family protein [Thermomicrobiales bacterium]|nr:uroporphyrinogen decarboxylase family protein [Thermomicrobiales bacterium]